MGLLKSVESCQQIMVQIIQLLCQSISVAIITPETNLFLNLSSAQHFTPPVSDFIHAIFFCEKDIPIHQPWTPLYLPSILIFINSPLLWNKMPSNILQIKDPKRFHVVLRHFLFQLSVVLYLPVFVLYFIVFVFVCCPCFLYLSFWGAHFQAQPFV